jgi:hypothetical protein
MTKQPFLSVKARCVMGLVAAVSWGWLFLLAYCRLALATLGNDQDAGTYSCTVYYTPKESGFSEKAGFDMTLQTLPSFPDRTFSADFLKAARMEGSGRLDRSINGKKYLAYIGSWTLLERPLGNRNNPLEPMRSVAISRGGGTWKRGDWLLIRSESLPGRFRNSVWRADDIGDGVGGKQLDLYCGEDNPSGPGENLFRPATKNIGRVREVSVYVVSDRLLLRKVLDLAHTLRLPFLARLLLGGES